MTETSTIGSDNHAPAEPDPHSLEKQRDELIARRDDLLARRDEMQRQLDARIARDDALLAELEVRRQRNRRNLDFYAKHMALTGLLQLMRNQEWLRNIELNLKCFGLPVNPPPPVNDLPPELLDRFTLGGRIPVFRDFHDNTYPSNHPLIYTDAEIDCYVDRIAHREYYIYGSVDHFLWDAFARYPVAGLELAVMGSRTPWYEATCVKFGAQPTTIEYNPILARSDRIRTITSEEWELDRPRFDGAISISSFEHDGLGAYGDPIDPEGDLKAMAKMKEIVKPGGLMFFNVPLGPDRLMWNRARVYGPVRLPILLEGWTLLESFGMEPQYLDGTADGQPLMVLRND